MNIDNFFHSRMYFSSIGLSVLKSLFSGQNPSFTNSTTLAKLESASCSLDQSTFWRDVDFKVTGAVESSDSTLTEFETTSVSKYGQESLLTV